MRTRSSSALLSSLLPFTLAVSPALTVDAHASSSVWPWSTAAHTAHQMPVQPGILPAITAEALDKTVLNLPGQLEGSENLLLLSWDRDQSAQIDTWTAVAQALQHTQPGFRVYRMLVSEPENMLFRWWDNASLRAAETDPDLLHWDVPLYTDEARLRQAIDLNGGDRRIIALLIDRSGRIAWKASGPSTAASRSGLMAAVGAGR